MKRMFIVGNEFRHCEYSNNPLPPVSFYLDIVWDWEVDTATNESVVFTESSVQNAIRFSGAKKVAWLLEPYDLIQERYDWIQKNNTQFKYVFTHEKTLLDKGENYKFIPFGGCWIPEQQRYVHTKDKMVSIVSSGKRELVGHRLRHEVVQKYFDVMDVFGRGYTPIQNKTDGIGSYAFSVVIENCKRDYWFTEKLIDCLMVGTVPIYWGCPSIGDFFDTRGFIIWDGVSELDDILKTISFEKYNEMMPYIIKNHELAKQYVLAERFIDIKYVQTGEL